MQVAFREAFDRDRFADFDILSFTKSGSVATFITRGEKDVTTEKIRAMNPILLDVLPLNLEEVFIYEMEALGYAFKDIM